jgi:endonuclease/exonuclease/phosphatase (EEP) superfamily protein YafD
MEGRRGLILPALALASLALSLAAQAARWWAALDVLTTLAPLGVAGSLVLLACGLWRIGPRLRSPTAVALAGGAVAMWAGLVAPEYLRPETSSRAVSPSSVRLRVIQLNVGGSGLKDPDRVAAWLQAQAPDVVFLDDAEASLHAALIRRGFVWRKGTAWTALLARQPLSGSAKPFSARDWKTMPDMARGRYESAAGTMEVIATHLFRPLRAGSGVQAGQLCALVARYDRRTLILGGDFNRTPWSFGLRRLDRCLGLTRRDRADLTWPARAFAADWPIPFLPIDHIYAGPAWRTVAVRIGPPIGATHRPLVVDLARAP